MAVSNLRLCGLLLTLSLLSEGAAWSQLYANSRSTSHVKINGTVPHKLGWNLSFYDWLSPEEITGPAVSENGELFVAVDTGANVSLKAIAANGSVLWSLNALCSMIPSNDEESYPFTLLYSNVLKVVVFESLYCDSSVFGINKNGTIRWHVKAGAESSKDASLSEDERRLFFFGFPGGTENNCSKGTALSLSVEDGSVLSEDRNTYCDPFQSLGYSWPSKVTTVNNQEMVVVPYFNYHNIVAFNARDLGGHIWIFEYPVYHLFTVDVMGITFNGKDTFYGSLTYDLEEPHNFIFGLNAQNGSLVFNKTDYCVTIPTIHSRTSRPVADNNGNGYYSCGYCMFSIYPNGSLRWQSQTFRFADDTPTPPSLNPDTNHLYVFNWNILIVLSMSDGKLIKSTQLPYLGAYPPILVGNDLMYLITGSENELHVLARGQ